MRIASLTMCNWQPYRGEHRLELQPKAYAVTAVRDGDANASNWSGKSALLEAVDFALHGRHNHRLEDDWITDGEKEGSVLVELDDGTVVKRSRKRGKSTQLLVTPPSAVTSSKGDEAQALVASMMGLTPGDFLATCYFQQRQMARFILSKPEDRMGIVREWFRLERLELAEEACRANILRLTMAMAAVRQKIDALDAQLRANVDDSVFRVLDDEVAQAKGALELATRLMDEESEVELRREKFAAFHALVVEGKRLAKELEDVVPVFEEDLQAAALENGEAFAEAEEGAREVRRLKALARGEWDGKCPVAGIACPATAEINARVAQNAGLLRAAEVVLGERNQRKLWAESEFSKLKARSQQRDRLETRLEHMRGEASKMMAEPWYEEGQPDPPTGIPSKARTRFQEAAEHLASVHAKRKHAEAVRSQQGAAREEAKKLRAQAAEVDGQLAVWRSALLIFGKGGAQRRVAEGVLAHLEAGANGMLAEAGVPLALKILWGREGAGPAKSCAECGAPFPASRREKRCARCGAERGNNVINRLDVDLTDRSGAAEDLAGAALQLSASAWLRSDRGSDWAVALIDEPTSALDAANRKAFSSHLNSMLLSGHFAQAFVVAHNAGVLDALPGRILIENNGGDAKVRVVA